MTNNPGLGRNAPGAGAEIHELLGREEAFADKLADDPEIRRTLALPVLRPLDAVPVAPEEGVEVPAAEAPNRLGHLALEREATHLAVGNDLEPRLLLESDGPIDGAVLDLHERRGRHASGHELVPSAQELWRAQQASDDVRVGDNHGRLLKERTINLVARHCQINWA